MPRPTINIPEKVMSDGTRCIAELRPVICLYGQRNLCCCQCDEWRKCRVQNREAGGTVMPCDNDDADGCLFRKVKRNK